MEIRVAGLCVCIMTALLVSTAQGGSASGKCSPDKFHLLTEVKEAAEVCGASLLSSWTVEDKAQLLRSLATLSELLKQDLLKVCSLSDGTPAVEVHSNGGIVCVTVDGKVYCKPMCDHGYDFNFLRRSRLYEVCSTGTWTTQFIGGNKIAICMSSTIQISATPSSYFPQGQSCLQTQQLHQEDAIIQQFITELSDQQITGAPVNASLICRVTA